VHREFDSGLAVFGGGEDLLLDGGDAGIAGDNNSHDTTLHFNTEREGHDVEEQEILGLSGVGGVGEDGSLDSGTVCDSFVWVDAFVQLFAIEELLQERLDLGDTSGTTDKNDLVDILLLYTSVL